MKSYYDWPTQVRFYVPDDGGSYCGGIAYHDEIICGCCGIAFSIRDVIDSTPDALLPIREIDYWQNISPDIMDEDSEPNDDDTNYEQLGLFDNEDQRQLECGECHCECGSVGVCYGRKDCAIGQINKIKRETN